MKHLTFALFLTFYLDVSIQALTLGMTRDSSSTKSNVKISRRNALIQGSASIAGLVGASNSASAELLPAETIDLSAIKAAQSKTASAPGIMSSTGKRATTIIPIFNDTKNEQFEKCHTCKGCKQIAHGQTQINMAQAQESINDCLPTPDDFHRQSRHPLRLFLTRSFFIIVMSTSSMGIFSFNSL